MKAQTRRRLTMFGTGLFIGCILSLFLLKYAGELNGPRQVQKVEVVTTSCDLEPGDLLREECVESRIVNYQLVPPQALSSSDLGMYDDRPIRVALDKGSVVRTVDFDDAQTRD